MNPNTSKTERPIESEDARDLRNTLLYAGIITIGMSVMILATSPLVMSLQIPPMETTLLALCSATVSVIGIYGVHKGWPIRAISWSALTAYAMIITITVHYTGGPLTPMPALYLLVVVAASFLLGRQGATIIAIVSITSYALMLLLEYLGVIQMILIWDITFDPQTRGALLIINWLAVAIPTLITSQLAGVLAERLKETNAELIESERMQNSLTHMIIHDLRNPITAVTGALDLLLMTLGSKMTEDQKNLLRNAQHSGKMLLGLVGELLDINKMEAGKFELHLEPVNICKLVAQNTEAMRAAAELEGQNLEITACPTETVINCDPQLISRVIANLLTNAFKYTPEGGTITSKVEREDEMVIISVTDTGPGIPPKYREHIFEKFGQIKQDGPRQGTGLGLTLCKMAAQAHGGDIWVESAVGEGSTFAFSLPIVGPASVHVEF
ncbi:MAG: sensor histidine kinase [Anaerolineales bacterium]